MTTLEHRAVTIRPAGATDADALSALVGQLGYPAPPEAMPERLARMHASGAVLTLVAELEGAVVGFVSAHLLATIHSATPVAWLTALVVADAARGRGVGKRLVRSAEEWAVAHGAMRIAVTSAAARADAHVFYERLGYERTGVRFGRRFG